MLFRSSLSRQSGLLKELNIIANNLANINTTGFKREGAVFTEFVQAAGGEALADDARHSLSIGRLGAHVSDFDEGEIKKTGGTLDVAIEGDGFFLVETPGGQRLTRAGHFLTNQEGTIVMPSGFAVLDDAGGQIQVPQDVNQIVIARDGTISGDGQELGRLGVVTAEARTLFRTGENLWEAREGFAQIEAPNVLQGFLEDSNVQPVAEIARMIEVQRHYDAGQKLLEMEDERIRSVISTARQLA